ncbi:MAG: PAS domain-containing protein [Spirochaetales bacterium]|nr:PAS domain-containing protein [Spirochaetales bacterium]
MNKELLNTCKALVEFLGKVLGENIEIVLHDLSDYENSILAIQNSLSGRNVGGPVTDFALKVLKHSQSNNKDYFINYKGKTANGKALRSSTMIIRDENKKPAAMICINIDISQYEQAKSLLETLINGDESMEFDDLGETSVKITENINSSIEELTSSMVEKVLGNNSIPPERMTLNEKLVVIKSLNDEGFFLLKGAVREIAARMKTSEATVYRYISKIE